MHDGFLRDLAGRPRKKKLSPQPDEDINEDINEDVNEGTKSDEYPGDVSQPKLQLLKFDGSEGSLWQKAWEQTKADPSCALPTEWHLESLDAGNEVDQVALEASARARDAHQNERRIGHSKYTYRQIFDNIANYVDKFKSVGDLLVQADPGYATLPWALVRFCLGIAVSESETYHRMLTGTEFVSQLVAQYPVIERTYARVDSKLAVAVRKTIYDLYLSILKFQVFAIQYFNPDAKAYRAARGFNPVAADNIKAQIETIHNMRAQANEDLILVHSEVTKRGIEDLSDTLDSHQKEIMQITKDGILALAQNTGSSFQKQTSLLEDKFSEAEQRNTERFQAISDLWQGPLDKLSDELQKQELYREDEALRRLRHWLSKAEPETDYQDARAKRNYQELGEWLLEHPQFQNWETSEKSSLFWLHGFAGTGKTGLACRAIEHLHNQSEQQSNCRFAFFFCSNDQGETGRDNVYSRSDPEEALRSIVSRLSTSSKTRSAATVVQDKFKDCGPDSDKPRTLSYDDCVEVIVDLARRMSIVIVLDAFDELNRNKSPLLLDHLQSILIRSPQRVKVFLSTRSFPAIERHLSSDQGIEVTTELNGKDVRTFIQKTLDDQVQRKNLLRGQASETIKSEIENTLASRARNMFLYASLMLSQICDPNNNDDEESVRKKLDKLPSNITAVYDGVMDQIHDNAENSLRSCQIAQQTFKWLLQTKETLLCDFLVEAISSLETSANKEEIETACRTLVVRGKLQGMETFEFAHYSVREHVGKMDEYSASKCHVVALRSCLHALNSSSLPIHSDVHDDVLDDTDVLDGKGLLTNYALLYWPLHFEGIEASDMKQHAPEINSMMRNFLIRGRGKIDRYAMWYPQAQRMVKKLRDDTYLTKKLHQIEAKPLTSLFAACVFGIEDVVGKFGREPGGLNKTNVSGQTALCLAIENGKLDVTKALLTRRIPADINLLNVNAVHQFEDYDHEHPPDVLLYASALQCAAATGAREIVEYLVEEGAHIDLVAGYFGSPLQAAAANGHTSVVSLLLARGAEPNSQGGFYGNALQAAAAQGHSDVINLLLESKPPALVDTPGGYYGSALMAAICSGDADTVWALLEERAQPNLKSKRHGLPLEKAASMGGRFNEIVSLLLDVKAKADLTRRGTSIHLLHKAALYNMRDLAEHCLRQNCSVNMTTNEGPAYHRRFGDFPTEMTPLGFACAEGHVEMVEFLLDRGAPFELERPQSAPLWTAAYQGHAKVVDLLLTRFKLNKDNGKVQDFLAKKPGPKSGHPILYAAVSSGDLETVRVLRKHGAEYRANWFNVTPLMASATFRAPKITSYFLECHKSGELDAEINRQANNGRTALIEACAGNRINVAPLLLKGGVDHKLLDSGGATALHQTTNHNNEGLGLQVIDHALENDSKDGFLDFVNTRHSSGKTALVDCAARNRPTMLEKLLDTGADYNIGGNAGNNPLHHAAINGNTGIMKLLLVKVKADLKLQPDRFQEYLDRKNGDLKTALLCACEANQPKVFEVLLDFGADWSIRNKTEGCVLHSACYSGFENIFHSLLDVASASSDPDRFVKFLNYRNNQGKTALWDACDRSHIGIATRLLMEGADYTIPNKSDVTWLHKASYTSVKDVVVSLLDWLYQNKSTQELRSFIDQVNDQGKTALFDACHQGRTGIAQYLLVRGADWSIRNKSLVTPLMVASYENHIDCVTTLVEHVSKTADRERLLAYLNARNDQGKTAFIDASQCGNDGIARYLLDQGADYQLGNKDGFTALHFAAWRNRRSIVRLLLDRADTDDIVHHKDSLRFLNSASTSNGRTALCDAACQGFTPIVKDLLESGADWDCPGKKGKSPLHWAAKNELPDMLDILLGAALAREKQDSMVRGKLNKALESKDGEGLSVLDWIMKAGSREMARNLDRLRLRDPLLR